MYLEQMPDREGGNFYQGKKLDPTVFEKVFSESPERRITSEHLS